MSPLLSRRRVITVMAAAAGLPLLLKARESQARLVRWEGTALGAPASIGLYHDDEPRARAALEAATAELRRLEAIFSLYRADSAVSALNRAGVLNDAPAELMTLAALARHYAELSEGAFDPTVQPLWTAYFSHFTAADPDPAGPSRQTLAAALDLVDWRGFVVDQANRRLSFARPGMGVTLNGIAQGFITDRVADVLRGHGFASMLVDMGEPRALAAKPDGSAWTIGVSDPADPRRAVSSLRVVEQAVASSGGYGTIFDPAGRFTHLIDPRTGLTVPALQGVTVVAESAAKADALSTTLSLAPQARWRSILAAAGGGRALAVAPGAVVADISV